MPRFDRLELESSSNQPDEPNRRDESVRDERHWLSQADKERRRGFYENALRMYSRSLELDKSQVVGWVGQVQMLVAQGEYPEAELWARKALELFKNHAYLLAGRAQALCRMKDQKQAVASSDAALAQPGHSAYRWMVRGEVMIVSGEVDRYCFDKAIQIESDWLVPLEIAQIYLYHRRPTKALPRARQAVEKAADQAYPWYIQGVCERELNMIDAARRSFRRCLEIVPNHADADRALHELRDSGWSLGRAIKNLFRRS